MNQQPLMILVAGPYRSGTNDDPARIEANVQHMNDVAWEVYQRGHLPVLGEWFALPLIQTAGSQAIGDAIFNKIFHPIAIRLLHRCDAVLRTGGDSQGADEMVRVGKEQGKIIFSTIQEVPDISLKQDF